MSNVDTIQHLEHLVEQLEMDLADARAAVVELADVVTALLTAYAIDPEALPMYQRAVGLKAKAQG